MERKNGEHPTVRRQERSRGTGRTIPSMDSSFRVSLRGFQFPENFPGPDATEAEARAYLLGPTTYAFRGYRPRIPTSNGLNHNSHH